MNLWFKTPQTGVFSFLINSESRVYRIIENTLQWLVKWEFNQNVDIKKKKKKKIATRHCEVTQLCLTLCDPMDCSPPGSSIHGIFYARVLEWVSISFSRGSSQAKDQTWVSHIAGRRFTFWATKESQPDIQFSSVQSLSRVWLFATPCITAHQASLSITNSRSSLRLTSIESVMPSSHLILCRPLLLLPPIPPSIRVFSNESTLCMRWPKY